MLEANCHNKCDSRKRLMLEKPRQVFSSKPGRAETETGGVTSLERCKVVKVKLKEFEFMLKGGSD